MNQEERQERPVLTVSQVAELFGLNPNTVYRMIRENRFPIRPLPLLARRYLFSRAAIERLVESTR